MIYEIKNKPYIKVENFFSEVQIQKGQIVPAKEFHKIYISDIDENDIKVYESQEEYIEKKKSKF